MSQTGRRGGQAATLGILCRIAAAARLIRELLKHIFGIRKGAIQARQSAHVVA